MLRRIAAAIPAMILAGCASPGSPWLFDPDGRGERRLIRPGMEATAVQAWKGRPLAEPYYNANARDGRLTLEPGFTGVAYWPMTTNRHAAVTFEGGIVKEVKYVINRRKLLPSLDGRPTWAPEYVPAPGEYQAPPPPRPLPEPRIEPK